jgi:HAD superfamily hydrolase (TIGR01662 family)
MSDITLILGYNGGGKSTYAESYVAQGYTRLNRDELGGKLDSLPVLLTDLHKKGNRKFVLDNTYADIESRKSIIECGKKLGLPVNCIWLDTSFEDAQFNACQRMIRKTGKLLSPEEMKITKDPNLFPPVALFSYKKRFQKPTTAEGFSTVNRVAFVRKKDPKYCNKALILDYDDTLRRSKGEHPFPVKPEDVEILSGRTKKLREYQEKGYQLFGVSNQSGVAKGILTAAQAHACFERTNELLGLHIDYKFCPHNIPPVNCYCRKPHVGHGVWLIEEHLLDREQCIFVGDQTTDKTFAQRCGFRYYHADEFFV